MVIVIWLLALSLAFLWGCAAGEEKGAPEGGEGSAGQASSGGADWAQARFTAAGEVKRETEYQHLFNGIVYLRDGERGGQADLYPFFQEHDMVGDLGDTVFLEWNCDVRRNKK